MTCEHCREQILPYLYELLEPAERESITAHLESCATCQDALKAAREQVGMMAEAVKPVQATIVFKAPVKATPASTAPTLLLNPRPRRLYLLNRWSVAASMLMVLFSLGAVVGWSTWSDRSAARIEAENRLAKARIDLRKTQEEMNHKRDKTQTEIRAIQKEIDEVFKNWKKEEAKTRETLEKERVQIIVNGPRVPLAGAANYYNVEVRGGQRAQMQQAPVGKGQANTNQFDNLSQLNARVVNQKTNEILYEQQLKLQQNNKTQFNLPPGLPIKPNDDLIIEFQTQDAEGKAVSVRDNLKLVFPDYVTHLASDRPMYRPGETVRFRSLTLERFSLTPPDQDFHLRYRIQGPRGEEIYTKEAASQVVAGKDNAPIKGPDGKPLRGLGAGEFMLPADLPEGLYTLSVSEVNERFNDEKRTFQVRTWQAPRFNKDVTFNRTSYGPGDQVKVTVRATPLQGPGFANNIQVSATANVDGQILHVEQRRDFNAANEARVEFTFNLPGQLFKGIGTISIRCDDGAGNHDTTVRNVPIVLRDLQVDFYPEGGDLIAGIPNRVYFQARTPANRPADFEGVILDDRFQEVARIQTMTDEREPGINQGLGSFTFSPELGKAYRLRIDAPIGVERHILLPIAKEKGVVLNIPQGVVENEIELMLHSAGQPRELLVGAYCRGRMLDHKFVKVGANDSTPVTLRPQAQVGGVYRITVFEKTKDADGVYFRPLAERLVYRKRQAHVEVAVTSDRKSYQPGETVELHFQAQNEKKEFVPTIAMVAVVDSSVRRLNDDKTERAMPTHFLLTTEVRNPEDLENADVLLGDHPRSAIALDLLLGAQGWRRFAEQDPGKFALRNQQKKAPIFLANSDTVPQFLNAEQKQIDKLDAGFVTTAIELNKKLAEKERDEPGPRQLQNEMAAFQREMQASQNQIDEANRQMRGIRGFLFQFGLGGVLLTLLFVGFFLISLGLRRLSEGGHARPWIFAGLALLGLLFLVSVIGTFALMGEPLLDDFGFRNDMRFGKMAPPMAMMAKEDDIAFRLDNEPPLPAVQDVELLDDRKLNAAAAERKPLARIAARPRDLQFGVDDVNQAWNQRQGGRMGPNAVDMDRMLRQQGDFQAILQRQLNRRVTLPAVNEPCIVREYAHQHKPEKDNVRRDFSETVYWHPVLVLPDGKAQVKFDLSDSVTRYEVAVLSHTFDGRLGANRIEISAKLPFSVEPKTPTEVTTGDQIVIPVAITNEMSKQISADLSTRVKGLTLEGNAERTVTLKANETGRELYRLTPQAGEGEAVFRVAGKTPGKGDAVERKFKIVRDGFPVTGSISGVLDNGNREHAIVMPDEWIPGSLQVQARFYPTSLAELTSGLDALLHEPTGCFEQSSSSNYPNVLVLQFLKETRQENPLAEKRARQLMQSGYQKLTAFECVDPDDRTAKRGYEWFGGDAPPHEALTAYGLMQFRDMAKLQRVDEAMLARTEKYLLDQRDGVGGFKRNPRGLDHFGRAPDPITNAYILWALTESGVKENLDVELGILREQTRNSKDPYHLALVGLSHLNRKRTAPGIEILRQVRALQKEDGRVTGAKTSITGSQGHDLDVETTSLAILGWLKADRGEFNPNVHNAVKWLGQQRRGAGSFGGTQATILALKAMIAHTSKHPRFLQSGEAQITLRNLQPGIDPRPPFRGDGFDFIDAKETNRASFTPRSQEPIIVSLIEPTAFSPGNNVVNLTLTNNATMPYTLTWSYRTLKPANDAKAPVKISTKLADGPFKEGDTVKLKATLENVSGAGQGMTVAIIGLPGGLAVPEDAQQLKGLAPDKISAWELRGRELVFYWRDLAPGAKKEIELDLICRLPGVYRGPASRAYLYYDADRKFWAEPLSVRIAEAK